MDGGIVFKNGGPLGWLGDRQDETATSATSKKVVDCWHLCKSLSDSGVTLTDITSPTILYNDNVRVFGGLTTWHPKSLGTFDSVKTLFSNGFRIKLLQSNTLLAR
jgi:hypothetical protein